MTRIRRAFPLHLALAGLVAYLALEWLSFIHEYKGLPITPWNPGLGVVFAQLLKRGPAFSAVLFAGLMISQLAVLDTPLDLLSVTVTSAIITTVYGTAAFVLRRFFSFSPAIATLRDLVQVLIGGVAGSCAASALVFLFLVFDGQLGWSDVEIAALPMLLGDIIGIAVMTPLVLRLAHLGWRQLLPTALRPEIMAHAGFILAVILLMSFGYLQDETRYFYLLFLPVTIAAIHFGLDGACLSLAFTQFALVAGLHVSDAGADAFAEFQRLMFVLTTTGLTIGTAVNERQRASDHARRTEASLRDMEAEAGHAVRLHLVSGMASALAHEINQPMTAARAYARSANHILEQPAPDLPRAIRNLSLATAQIDHAGAVLSQMRDRLRRTAPRITRTSIPAMLDDVLPLIRADARSEPVNIEFDTPAHLPEVAGDRVQLMQVLVNLIRNAVEAIIAAQPGTGTVRVVVRALVNPPRMEFAVNDNGPGVPDDLAGCLFEPLTTSKPDGHGLGLPICMSIIEAHGGRLWLRSHEPGNTEFRFTIPLDRAGTP